mmetsp:Transcript_85907/g.170517  ORF Transcript_85907/g.170517 Transcript_85907/m.170517 type:complete len:165 (+) Transcript_85907:79-573(+)
MLATMVRGSLFLLWLLLFAGTPAWSGVHFGVAAAESEAAGQSTGDDADSSEGSSATDTEQAAEMTLEEEIKLQESTLEKMIGSLRSIAGSDSASAVFKGVGKIADVMDSSLKRARTLEGEERLAALDEALAQRERFIKSLSETQDKLQQEGQTDGPFHTSGSEL